MEERIAKLEAVSDSTAKTLAAFQQHVDDEFKNVRAEMNDRFQQQKEDAAEANRAHQTGREALQRHVDEGFRSTKLDIDNLRDHTDEGFRNTKLDIDALREHTDAGFRGVETRIGGLEETLTDIRQRPPTARGEVPARTQLQ